MSEELKEQIRQLLREELSIQVATEDRGLKVRLYLNGEPIDSDWTYLGIDD